MTHERDFACDACRTTLRLADDRGWGRSVRCPHCGAATVAWRPAAKPVARVEARLVPSRVRKTAVPPAVPLTEPIAKAAPRAAWWRPGAGAAWGAAAMAVSAGFLALVASSGLLRSARIVPPAVAPRVFLRCDCPSFSIEFPMDWPIERGGDAGHDAWATAAADGAFIAARDDQRSSVEGDIAHGHAVANFDPEPQHAAVRDQHRRAGMEIKSRCEEFAEGPADFYPSPLGYACWSEYSAVVRRNVKVRGLRATVRGPAKTWLVRCECRAEDWESLAPAFFRAFDSLGFPAPPR